MECIVVTLFCSAHDGTDKAVTLMQQQFPSVSPLEVTLQKRIPVAAGLAGGSTDLVTLFCSAHDGTDGLPCERGVIWLLLKHLTRLRQFWTKKYFIERKDRLNLAGDKEILSAGWGSA